MASKLVVGITGTLLSGKGTVAEILHSKGFHVVDLGEIVRDECKARGLSNTRANQQDVGNGLRKEFGGQIFAERALKKYNSYDSPLVIIGLRNMVEIDFLKANSNFVLIGVDAPFETRWERLQKRNRDPDLLNHDKFVIDDARDRGFNEPLNGQQVGMCLVHADYLINNDEEISGPIENSKLYKEVMEVYRKLKK